MVISGNVIKILAFFKYVFGGKMHINIGFESYAIVESENVLAYYVFICSKF